MTIIIIGLYIRSYIFCIKSCHEMKGDVYGWKVSTTIIVMKGTKVQNPRRDFQT